MNNRVVLILFFITNLNFVLSQGPIDGFMKGRDNLDVAIGYSNQSSERYYGSMDQEFDLNFGANMISVFAQYGIAESLDAVFSLPFIFGSSENKFQDMGLYLKGRPLHFRSENQFEFSTILSTGLKFPASDYKPDITGSLGQRAKVLPFSGILQAKFRNGLFINGTYTYSFRLDRIEESEKEELSENLDDDEIIPKNFGNALFRLGLATSKHFVELFFEIQKTFGGLDFVEGEQQPSQLYGVDFIKIGGTYYFDSNENGIAVNISQILSGRNIGDITSIGISFILKYRKQNE